LQEECIAPENGPCNSTGTIHNGYCFKEITRKFKIHNLSLALYILMHKALRVDMWLGMFWQNSEYEVLGQ
jgi:hypothetical protein